MEKDGGARASAIFFFAWLRCGTKASPNVSIKGKGDYKYCFGSMLPVFFGTGPLCHALA